MRRDLSTLADQNRALIKGMMTAQVRALDQVARVIKAPPDRRTSRTVRS